MPGDSSLRAAVPGTLLTRPSGLSIQKPNPPWRKRRRSNRKKRWTTAYRALKKQTATSPSVSVWFRISGLLARGYQIQVSGNSFRGLVAKQLAQIITSHVLFYLRLGHCRWTGYIFLSTRDFFFTFSFLYQAQWQKSKMLITLTILWKQSGACRNTFLKVKVSVSKSSPTWFKKVATTLM